MVSLIGDGEVYCEGEWMPSSAHDVLPAPCGVHQSVGGSRNLSYGCGYASLRQLDLAIDSPYFQAGTFTAPPWTVLPNAPAK